MGGFGLFDIGKTALLMNRRALDTIAHNVANSATPGYTRQDVVLENIPTGDITAVGTTGRGVRITEVKRMYDAFLTLQLRTEKSNLSYWNAYEKGVVKIENIFNEASDTGISTAITDFFNAWQEVAQNPEGYAQRTLLIKKAEYMSSRISGAYTMLDDGRTEIFKSSQSLVNEVNSIAAKIAYLNDKIAAVPGALDLKDQRDLLIEKLNEIVKVSTFEDNVGRYSVLIGGTPLVDGGKTYKMSVTTDTANAMHFYVDLESEVREINSYITGGELKANLDLRETNILSIMNRLNAFAIDLSFTVNYYHRQGYGLDNSTGNDFFRQLYSITDSSPAVGGTVAGIDFTNISVVNLGKMYRIDYNTVGGAGYQQEEAGATDIYWRVQESTDGTTWTTINPLSVTLSSDTSTIPDYRTLEFSGIKIRIDGNQSDLVTTVTEQFGISFNSNAAKYMATAITDPQKVAAAQTDPSDPSGGVGDNRNARLIADLINQRIIAGAIPIDFYRSMVSDVGVDASSSKINMKFQSTLVEELERRRQEVSGVSLDEEAANLIKYQKAFQASAKLISVADELLETLIAMTGRR